MKARAYYTTARKIAIYPRALNVDIIFFKLKRLESLAFLLQNLLKAPSFDTHMNCTASILKQSLLLIHSEKSFISHSQYHIGEAIDFIVNRSRNKRI